MKPLLTGSIDSFSKGGTTMKNQIKTPIYKAALYLRLSVEKLNEAIGQSDSIANQEALLCAHLKNHPDIEICDVFKDDGWSGVSFDRPGFQKMMQKIYDSEINCVVVKDLSRLGRNHTETGKYITRVFPAFGVRFISVNDNIDTIRRDHDLDSIIIPFKDLLNDSYSRDISIKIRSALEIKRKQGLYVGGNTRFGYMKNPNDKNKLIIDEEAAEIVRKIFKWTIEGYGNKAIACKLNEMCFPAPDEYQKLRREGKKPISTNPKWYPIAINRILRSDMYIGVLTQGITTTPNYKVKKYYKRPQEEIVRMVNALPPIIPESEFELVREIIKMDVITKSRHGKKVPPLSGLVFCSDCGGNMILKKTFDRTKTKKYEYYVCGEHNRDVSVCFYHGIRADALEKQALEAINLQLQIMFDTEPYLKTIEKLPYRCPDIEQLQIRIGRMAEEKQKMLKLSRECYKDFKEGLLSEYELRNMRAEYEKRAKKAENIIVSLEQEKEKLSRQKLPDLSWLETYRERGRFDKLTREIAVRMIKRIEVTNCGKISIQFRFGDLFKTEKNKVKRA